MAKVIIDATDLILGRMSAYVAKQAILGNQIDIVNCEECVIKGTKDSILENYRQKFSRGTHAKGPFMFKKPNFFVKRTIRGMIPYRRGRGKEAFKSIKCYIGVPENMKEQEFKTYDDINVLKRQSSRALKYMKLKELCRYLGWKSYV